MPEQVELRFERPPEFAHLSQEQWADKLRAAVAEQEQKAAAERQEAGTRIVGRKAILRRSPYSRPKSITERRGLKPRVATRNKWLRIELWQRNKRFQQRYRQAHESRRAGELDVLFPYGSYQLAVQGLVRCEAPTAPTGHLEGAVSSPKTPDGTPAQLPHALPSDWGGCCGCWAGWQAWPSSGGS